jgi:hypothetical protein
MNAVLELDAAQCRAQEIEMFRAEFLRFVAMEDTSQPCPVGRTHIGGAGFSRRETIAEMVTYNWDEAEAAALICKAARGESIEDEAQALLLRLAQRWADDRSEL